MEKYICILTESKFPLHAGHADECMHRKAMSQIKVAIEFTNEK
jgi:hypothetical protein